MSKEVREMFYYGDSGKDAGRGLNFRILDYSHRKIMISLIVKSLDLEKQELMFLLLAKLLLERVKGDSRKLN